MSYEAMWISHVQYHLLCLIICRETSVTEIILSRIYLEIKL